MGDLLRSACILSAVFCVAFTPATVVAQAYDASFPGGFAVPAGVSREIVLRLNAEINKALKSRSVIERFEATGVVVGGGTPEQFAELIRSETAKWAKVIKAAGIKAE